MWLKALGAARNRRGCHFGSAGPFGTLATRETFGEGIAADVATETGVDGPLPAEATDFAAFHHFPKLLANLHECRSEWGHERPCDTFKQHSPRYNHGHDEREVTRDADHSCGIEPAGKSDTFWHNIWGPPNQTKSRITIEPFSLLQAPLDPRSLPSLFGVSLSARVSLVGPLSVCYRVCQVERIIPRRTTCPVMSASSAAADKDYAFYEETARVVAEEQAVRCVETSPRPPRRARD